MFCIESQLMVDPFTTPTAWFKRMRKPVTSPKSRRAICHVEAQALTTLDLKQWLLYHPSFKPPPLKCNHKRCIEEVSGWKNTWIPTKRIVCISQCHAAHYSWEAGISGNRDNQANVNVKQHPRYVFTLQYANHNQPNAASQPFPYIPVL